MRYPHLLVAGLHVGSPLHAVNIHVPLLKNTGVHAESSWEYAELVVADPVAGADTTLCLDNTL